MSDQYQQLIATLATKMGTTVEHLWGVLTRQAMISGTVDLLLCACLVTATTLLVGFVKRKTTPPHQSEYSFDNAECEHEGAMIAWLFAVVAVVITVAVIMGSAEGIVAAFMNPEYWALMKIIRG